MKTRLRFLKISLLSFLLLPLVFSCNNEQKNWENAKQQNTIEAYKDFIAKNPESEFLTEAEQNIVDIDWKTVENTEDTTSLFEFINKYPDSKYSEIAENKIFDLDWANVNKDSSVESYQNFMTKYPKNKHASEVEQKIIDFEWDDALKAKNIKTYNEFINKHPESKYIENAKQRINDLEYTWKDGFLDKKYYGSQTKIDNSISEMFARCMAYSRQSIENGLIQANSVGDKNGNWSLNGEGGLVYVKRIWLDNYMIVGFKIDNGDRKASLYFHKVLQNKLDGFK